MIDQNVSMPGTVGVPRGADAPRIRRVTDDERPAAQTAGALDALLVDAKLSVPQPRPGVVPRSQVIERARASGCQVVGVSAPAGYGKTTLLAEWALAEERPVGWVSLDRFDDDPRLLLTLLASAYARVSPGQADLIADVGGLGVSTLGRAAPRLAAAFRASPHPFVLMLDDLHELQSPDCHDVLSVAISGIPRGSQLVAASRSEQPHLPRLRATGDALELLASDLALDTAGAARIFSQANVHLSPEQAASVTARTEGWPVGLYLAALIATDSSGKGLTISGDDRYVADYLYREALLQLPDSDQRFLRRTAVLDQLCAPLCDAVVGEPGAQERLRKLEAASLFLVPLDRRREWYRYHGLFREFLLGELRRVEPDVITKLHLRAADWYESNGSPVMAVEHSVEHGRAGPLHPVGDGIGPADLPGRQHLHRACVGCRRSATRPSRNTPRWRCSPAGSRCSPGRPPRRNGGRRSSTRRRSISCQRTARRRSSRRGPCCGPGCAPPVPSRCWPTGASRRPRSRHGASGATRRCACMARRCCSPATSTRPLPCSPRRPRSPPPCPTPIRSLTARPSWPCWRWIVGSGRRRPSTSTVHSVPSMSIGCRTTRRACSPSPAQPGSLCTEAT